jgi:hypothetical protein
MDFVLRLPDALFGANVLQHRQSPVSRRSSILIHELLISKQSASASFQKKTCNFIILVSYTSLSITATHHLISHSDAGVTVFNFAQ